MRTVAHPIILPIEGRAEAALQTIQDRISSPTNYAPIYIHSQIHLNPVLKTDLETHLKVVNSQKRTLKLLVDSKTKHVISEGFIGNPRRASNTCKAKVVREIRRINSPWLNSEKYTFNSNISLRQATDFSCDGAIEEYLKISKVPATLHSSGDMDTHEKAMEVVRNRENLQARRIETLSSFNKRVDDLNEKYPNPCLEKLREQRSIAEGMRKSGIAFDVEKENLDKMYKKWVLDGREASLVKSIVSVRRQYPNERIDVQYGDAHAENIKRIFFEKYPEMPIVHIGLERTNETSE
jgi:hypothetical protein